LRLTSWVER